jgi:hypothetical protein
MIFYGDENTYYVLNFNRKEKKSAKNRKDIFIFALSII